MTDRLGGNVQSLRQFGLREGGVGAPGADGGADGFRVKHHEDPSFRVMYSAYHAA